MRVFVGYGYNARDEWIEKQVFPILECMGFVVVHGKDMHGLVLQPEVQSRLDQSDAAVGFFTLRDGQGDADFTSHIWVRDEMVHANAKNKPIIPIKEVGVKVPDGLLGNRQYIPLDQNDRLGCVAELARALGRRNIRRIKLDPPDDQMRRSIFQWRLDQAFSIRYRTQDENGVETPFQTGRLEVVRAGFYLNAADVPRRGLIEVEGCLGAQTVFSSGWETADAVQVPIY
jgi:hypothetical protein